MLFSKSIFGVGGIIILIALILYFMKEMSFKLLLIFLVSAILLIIALGL